MNLIFTDPAVQSAAIQTLGAIIVALITTIVANVVGKVIANRKALQCKLVAAQQDIEFLLAVEALHCELHTTNSGNSMKYRIREEAKKRNSALKWSGQFTPGRAKSSITMQKAKLACEATS